MSTKIGLFFKQWFENNSTNNEVSINALLDKQKILVREKKKNLYEDVSNITRVFIIELCRQAFIRNYWQIYELLDLYVHSFARIHNFYTHLFGSSQGNTSHGQQKMNCAAKEIAL